MADISKPQLFEPSRSRPLPEIDTVWFDVSALLLMPSGYVSGITRTIHKILECWAATPWTRIKLCAFVADHGLHPAESGQDECCVGAEAGLRRRLGCKLA